MRKSIINALIISLMLSFSCQAASLASEENTVRVAVLKFGTVNWTLDIIKSRELDKKHGFDLHIIPLGSKNASHVALQGDGADIIVSDWLWVSRQRAEQRDYTFVPYSNASGALMVKSDSGIDTLSELAGKKLGIAGGPVDKSWLLLRAYAQKTLDIDLTTWLEPQFAAPPLLNKLAQRGELDAALNFWHYSARLKAAGFKSLISVREVLEGLGVEASVPVIGWVFSEQWAANNTALAEGFIRAAIEAQQLLLENDALWEQLRVKMKAEDEVLFNTLRTAYRQGVPACFGLEEQQAANAAFSILAKLGGRKLLGNTTTLSKGTFWHQNALLTCGK